MTRDNSKTRYGKLSITLHWLTLLLFVGVYACVEVKGYLPKGNDARGLLMGFHGLFGASIFALVWIRLLGRRTPRPPITPPPPTWQTGLALLTHLALYGLMIITPILAWLMLAAGDKPFPYFGFHFPAPIAIDLDNAKFIKSCHELLGNAGYWLVGLHAAAGLFHHYWMGDNTLQRMLFERKRS